jgi:NAD+ kinase
VRVAFVVHAGRPAALEVARDLVSRLQQAGETTRGLEAEDIGATETTAGAALGKQTDLVVSVGGDGTFLRAARLAFDHQAPVLGVKVGRMGFLTEVEPEQSFDLIRDALSGAVRIEERLALTAEPKAASWGEPQWALNEIIVEKKSRHRLIRLAVHVDGQRVTTFSADGVIVSTPTGSTAYSFSARGPIVSPTLRCLVVTPVAAHMVFDRSLVLAPDQLVSLEVVGDEPGILSADGRESLELPVGAAVEIGAAEYSSKLVKRNEGPSFFDLVKEKFELPGGSGT